MCLPVAAMAFSPLQMAASAISAYGSIMQGRSQAAMSNYNAQVLENNAQVAEMKAEDARIRGEASAQEIRRKGNALSAEQAAGYAANNLSLDSDALAALDFDTQVAVQADSMTIRENAAREAFGHKVDAQNSRTQARLERLRGKQAKRAGVIGAFNTALSGASKVRQRWYNFKNSTKKT